MRRSAMRSWVTGLLGAACSLATATAGTPASLDDQIFQAEEPSLVQQVSAEYATTSTPVASGKGARGHHGAGLNFFVGTEAVFLRPFQSGSAPVVSNVNGANVGGNEADDFYGAPRFWVGAGLDDSPLFFQLQYWELNGSETDTIVAPGPFGGTNFGSLRMNNFDFEGGALLCLEGGRTEGKVTFGGRHTTFDTASGFSTMGFLSPTDTASASGSSYSAFEGTGLTTSLQLTRRIGDSDWRLFTGGRFSWLWGEDSNGALTSASVSDGISNASSINGAFGGGDATMYIFEFQLGTQWQHRLKCLNADAFFRIAMEYQYWNTDSSSQALTGSFASLPGNSSTVLASSRGFETNLFGVAIGTGLTW